MSDSEILIKAVAKLELKPGDTLVVLLPLDRINSAAVHEIAETHKQMFGASIKLIIADDKMEFGVLTGGKKIP